MNAKEEEGEGEEKEEDPNKKMAMSKLQFSKTIPPLFERTTIRKAGTTPS